MGRIEELVQANPGQMTKEEYFCIAKTLKQMAPCNMLVFGVGRDSNLWYDLNQGITVYLEDDRGWIERTKEESPHLVVEYVHYSTRCADYLKLLRAFANGADCLKLQVPAKIRSVPWDIILIDGPRGFGPDCPGRMKPIYLASTLNARHVFIHDIHRHVEDVYSRWFFDSFEDVGKLRHCQ